MNKFKHKRILSKAKNLERRRFFFFKSKKYTSFRIGAKDRVGRALKPKLVAFAINIVVKSNNIFCALKHRATNKTIVLVSSGLLKIKVSKKLLKYKFKSVLRQFFYKIRSEIYKRTIFIFLTTPIKFRKKFIKILGRFFKYKYGAMHIKHRKCFNGCRPPKKRRRKQKSFIIFK